MAAEELHVIEIRDDFYRDSFGKVILIISCAVGAVGVLIALSLYLFLSKPNPVNFAVGDEWRVQPVVAVDQRYLADTDVLQWVSDAIQKAFVFDFYHYNDQLKTVSQYFTPGGWKVFLNQLNNYANYNNVQGYKLFVTAVPRGGPVIINQGLLSGRYAWWIQMPVTIKYQGYAPQASQDLSLQILVVRVSTQNNLSGVGIDNMIVANNSLNPLQPNSIQPQGNPNA